MRLCLASAVLLTRKKKKKKKQERRGEKSREKEEMENWTSRICFVPRNHNLVFFFFFFCSEPLPGREIANWLFMRTASRRFIRAYVFVYYARSPCACQRVRSDVASARAPRLKNDSLSLSLSLSLSHPPIPATLCEWFFGSICPDNEPRSLSFYCFFPIEIRDNRCTRLMHSLEMIVSLESVTYENRWFLCKIRGSTSARSSFWFVCWILQRLVYRVRYDSCIFLITRYLTFCRDFAVL